MSSGRYLLQGFLYLLMAFSGSAGAESLSIPGSGACETVLGKLAAEFNRSNPEIQVRVPPSVGSSGGIEAVIKGEAEIARVARRLKESEREQGLSYVAFAKDAVVFAAGSKAAVRALTRDQIADIFAGKISNWKAAGGADAPIRLLIREPGETSLILIKEQIGAFRDIQFPAQAKLMIHDLDMAETLNKYSTAIGWLTTSSIGAYGDGIVPLALDGVAPVAENLASGRYPMIVEYAFVYRKAQPRKLSQLFLEFVFSGAGRRALSAQGLVPVP